MIKGLIYDRPFMFRLTILTFFQKIYMPQTTLPIQEEGNMTITSECLIEFVQLIENMYMFSTKCLVITYLLIVSQLILLKKTETNKTYLTKTIIIDTN